MDPITHALNHVRNTIPPQILELAFSANSIIRKPNSWVNVNESQSVDYNIRDKVIEGRVNPDINLFGGNQVPIDLRGAGYEQIDWQTRVYRVPYELTGHRRIVAVQKLVYLNYYAYSGNYSNQTQGNDLSGALGDLYNAISQMPVVQTANVMIIGDNTIMVRDNVTHLSDQLALVAVVENEAGLANLAPGIYPLYAELVQYAVQAYIYNQLMIEIDRGLLIGGQELGQIRSMIERYEEAEQNYHETLISRWRKASFTNDRYRMYHFINTMVGRGN